MTQVFISYSRRDLAFVEQLAADLKAAGLDVWYDLSGLEGGQRWRVEIEKAIRGSQYVLVVLSPDSAASEWVEREYLFASNLKRKIVPLLYKQCDLPLDYLNLHYIDIQGENYRRNYEEILRVLSLKPEKEILVQRKWNRKNITVFVALTGLILVLIFGLPLLISPPENTPEPTRPLIPTHSSTPTKVITPTTTQLPSRITDEFGQEMVLIPAGEFIMGSNPDEPYFFGAESPRHKVYLDEYWIYRTEVANELYHLCVDAGVCQRPGSNKSDTHDDYYTNSMYDNYPVINVTYNDALSYCQWIGGRLPTEAEWEKAARGTEGFVYPWGNEEINSDLANFCDIGCSHLDEAELSFNDGYPDTAPVGSYPAGASPYGVLDMAGNVLEWVSDWYGTNYYYESPYQNPLGLDTGTRHPIRGGSWNSGRAGLRTSARASLTPDSFYDTVGFRCARDAPP